MRCSLPRALTALSALASAAALGAVRLHSAGKPQGPPQPAVATAPADTSAISGDTHFRNLASEGSDGSRPGDYELLRMPAEASRPALINLRGTFLPSRDVACGMYMKNFTLQGEWLGGKVVHVRWVDGFELKVSSSKPAVAGHWSSVEDFRLAGSGLPDTLEIVKMLDSPALKFQVGPRALQRRPMALLTPGRHDGLDLSLFNTKRLDLPLEPSRSLMEAPQKRQAAKHRSAACELRVNPLYQIKGDMHIWNLAGEGFDLDQSADQTLLRIPKDGRKPVLFDVRGTFAAAAGAGGAGGGAAPCGLQMTNVSLSGQWLGGKVLHVGWLDGFAFKVSSTRPAYAGPWRPLAEFARATRLRDGAEALPETLKMTEVENGTGLRFHVGSKSAPLRPTLLVTQGPFKGLDYAAFYAASFDAPEPAHLLGTDRQDEKLELRRALCKAMRRNASEPRIPELPSVSAM